MTLDVLRRRRRRLFFLDVFLEHGPGEVSETEPSVFPRVEEEVLRVDGLGLGDLDVDFPEIGRQSVADEDAAEVQQQPQLFVRDLERDEVVLAGPGVQIPRFDPGVLRHVVDDRLFDRDVVIDERDAFLRT